MGKIKVIRLYRNSAVHLQPMQPTGVERNQPACRVMQNRTRWWVDEIDASQLLFIKKSLCLSCLSRLLDRPMWFGEYALDEGVERNLREWLETARALRRCKR